MTRYHCLACNLPMPESFSHHCQACGGVFGLANGIQFDPAMSDSGLPGIWRFKHTFGLPPEAPVVSLGEGNTPLVCGNVGKMDVYFKMESTNPTGSFKDRLTAPLVSYLKGLGIQNAVEDSSGNAGASFAAYAARAGIKAKVYLPASASGPKRKQIEAYGATIEAVPGPRSEATKEVLKATQEGIAYGSHAYLPQGLPGIATIAYEILEQLGGVPGTVVAPVGHGSLLLGIIHGFLALSNTGLIETPPQFIGVQAMACAPLWHHFSKKDSPLEGDTVAEGIRVINPVRGPELLAIRERVPLQMIAVNESEIINWRDLLPSKGFYVEATSAVAVAAIAGLRQKIIKPIIVILTGTGLKSSY